MMIKDLHKAFKMECGDIPIIIDGKYTTDYVQWLEKKLIDFLTP